MLKRLSRKKKERPGQGARWGRRTVGTCAQGRGVSVGLGMVINFTLLS